MAVSVTVNEIAREGAEVLLGVARLGDGGARGWWRSSAMDSEVGGFILGNAFPRTARVAGAELALLSATRRHRQVLERPSAIHLFSDHLPFRQWTAAWLAEQKTGPVNPLLALLEAFDAAAASVWLGERVGSRSEKGSAVPGALDLGRVSAAELAKPEDALQIARRLAVHYLEMNTFEPPYLNLAER